MDARALAMSVVPLVTRDLPGIGGSVKKAPGDFVVEEIPLYEPSGEGEHVYVRHKRSDRNTRDVVQDLARAFRIDARDIGYAGLKDKRAIATQTFSLHLHKADVADVRTRIASEVGGEVLDVRRHGNKLRRGHLVGNRFTIRVTDTQPGSFERALTIADAIAMRGLPNAFGPQRYGDDGRNAERGRALIEKPRRGFLAELHMSAWQSSLFDRWLALRMERGLFEHVVAGDLAKKLDNGALFDVVDANVDDARVARREITHTGPIFGASMRTPTGVAAELEAQVFATENVTHEQLSRARLEGTRRAGRIFVDSLRVDRADADLLLSFGLSKGSYATVVLREFTKHDVDLAEDE